MNEPKNLAEPLKESMSRALQAPAKFDAEIYHVMDKRDEALISDEILHGSVSAVFVYKFPMSGQDGSKEVSGISVRGAAHLARHYGGLKHRIVASSDKRGKLFTFKSYPGDGQPMGVHCNIVPELADEPDAYEVVVELTDIKTGGSIQVSRLEKRYEKRRDGSAYERPNYTVIAESKAFRNAVLRLVPQEVQEEFKRLCIAQGKSIDITGSAIDEKRDNVIKFCAAKAISVTREQIYALDWNQISGLSEAAKEGIEIFRKSAEALQLISVAIENKKPQTKPEPPKSDNPPAPKADGRKGMFKKRGDTPENNGDPEANKQVAEQNVEAAKSSGNLNFGE